MTELFRADRIHETLINSQKSAGGAAASGGGTGSTADANAESGPYDAEPAEPVLTGDLEGGENDNNFAYAVHNGDGAGDY